MPTYKYHGKIYKLAETDTTKALERIQRFADAPKEPTKADWMAHRNAWMSSTGEGVGGMAGGIVGSRLAGQPGGRAGAMIGGGLGRGLGIMGEEATGGDVRNLNEFNQEMLQAAGRQGLYQYGGDKAAEALRAGAKQLFKFVYGTDRAAGAALEHGIPANQRGLKKLMGIINNMSGEQLAAGTASTSRYDANAIGDEILQRVEPELWRQGRSIKDVQKLRELVAEFKASHPSGVAAEDAIKMRHNSYVRSAPIIRLMEKNRPVGDELRIPAKFEWELANILKHEMHGDVQGVPEIAGLADIDRAIGPVSHLRDRLVPLLTNKAGLATRAAMRTAPMVAGAVVGGQRGADIGYNENDEQSRSRMGAIQGALAGYALSSPEVLSLLARALSSGAAANVTRQIPRGIGTLFGSFPEEDPWTVDENGNVARR